MIRRQRATGGKGGGESQPRGILRVPEVLTACAARPLGGSLAALCRGLQLPKTSLYRMLRTLEDGGYLTFQDGYYVPGPASFHMANLIGQRQQDTSFPASARPTIEWLARETNESVMIGVLSEERTEIIYNAGIDSPEPLRYTLPIGSRRPLFSGASGKAVLAFLAADERDAYLADVDFFQMTPSSTRREEMPEVLAQVHRSGVVYDRNGSFEGASAVACPIFDGEGQPVAAISLAGPTERMEANKDRFIALTRSAAERISRGLGYMGAYPPADGSGQ